MKFSLSFATLGCVTLGYCLVVNPALPPLFSFGNAKTAQHEARDYNSGTESKSDTAGGESKYPKVRVHSIAQKHLPDLLTMKQIPEKERFEFVNENEPDSDFDFRDPSELTDPWVRADLPDPDPNTPAQDNSGASVNSLDATNYRTRWTGGTGGSSSSSQQSNQQNNPTLGSNGGSPYVPTGTSAGVSVIVEPLIITNDTHGVTNPTLTATPEPSALLLTGSGVLSVAWFRRRRLGGKSKKALPVR
jgi:hypothetical protein